MAKPKTDPRGTLADHADSRDTIVFAEKILHGRIAFHKGEVVKFEDPAAAAYFDIAFNGTEFTDKKPTRTVTDEELNFEPDDPRGNETIDPHTVIGPGRLNVTPGTTVHQVASGNPDAGSGSAPLEAHDVTTRSKG
jgi:hypothetical protein